MRSQLREEAVRLRKENRLSYTEIRKRLGVAKSTLSEWLSDFPLSEAEIRKRQQEGWSKSEAARERYRNTMRKRQEEKDRKCYSRYYQKFEDFSQGEFFVAGLVLYLAEGSKTRRGDLSVSNTDPRVINMFIEWLVTFFEVDRGNFRCHLHIYENMDPEAEKKFWAHKLHLNESQFYKPDIRELKDGSFTYRESYRHGTCAVRLLNAYLWREVMQALNALLDRRFKIS